MTHHGSGRLIFVLVAALAAACGGAKPAAKAPEPKPDPIPHTAGPACKAVADHMVALAEHDVAHPEADTAFAKSVEDRCQKDKWPDDVRTCFGTINTQPEADGCMNMLPKDQRWALDAKKAEPEADASAMKAEEAPKRSTRGAVKKDAPKAKPKSKTSDPCEGGE
jgi:hypothetical protein